MILLRNLPRRPFQTMAFIFPYIQAIKCNLLTDCVFMQTQFLTFGLRERETDRER
jgi:hypothetical protein